MLKSEQDTLISILTRQVKINGNIHFVENKYKKL